MAKRTRRKFLKETAAVGVGVAVAGCVSGNKKSSAAHDNTESSRRVAGSNELPKVKLDSKTKVADVGDSFDFVIVGAGAGGAPLAGRLALAGFNTLLIDAGGDQSENDNVRIPAMHPRASEDPTMSWEFYVKHFTNGDDAKKVDAKYHAKGTLGQREGVYYPRASALGGCTVHNAMITMYNDNSDWEYIKQIAKKNGESNVDSWSADHMRYYFQALENKKYFTKSLSIVDRFHDRHGYKGWLSTEQADVRLLADSSVQDTLLSSVGAVGKTVSLRSGFDPNNWRYVNNKTESKSLLSLVPMATEGGVRSSPLNLLARAQKEAPGKLKILRNALVTKIIFEEKQGKSVAVGVELLEESGSLYEAHPKQENTTADQFRSTWESKKSSVKSVKVSKEVILSGGVYNTPQLLMMSGIGDDAHCDLMAKAGIKPIAKLNGVGRNLQDRYEYPITAKTKDEFKFLAGCDFSEVDKCLTDYLKSTQRSLQPYASNGAVVGIIHRSKNANSNDPDLFIFGLPLYFEGYKKGYSKQVYQPKTFTWLILKGHTAKFTKLGGVGAESLPDLGGSAAKYRGTVKLNSDDPFNPLRSPDINLNNFPDHDKNTEAGEQSRRDIEALYEATQIVREINAKMGIEDNDMLIPTNDIISDPQKMKKFIRDHAWGHHASCTAPMGVKGAEYTVVDTNFNVQGVENLRIVDASVFPRIPGMFIVTPIYMISEKAAETILQKYGKTSQLKTEGILK